MSPSPMGRCLERGQCSSPEKFWILDLKMSTSSAFWALFFAVQLPVVHAKNTAFGLRKLTAACRQTATGDKVSLLETIRGL